jgi:cytochrome P450
VIVIAEMLGIDAADRVDFKRWSELDIRTFNPFLSEAERAAVLSALGERDAYLGRVLARRRAEPRDDLLSALIAAEEAGDRLDDDEIVTMCELLLVAGNVTTTDLIGNGVWLLLRHPAELAKLRAEPSLIDHAVEEILRFESPVVQKSASPRPTWRSAAARCVVASRWSCSSPPPIGIQRCTRSPTAST